MATPKMDYDAMLKHVGTGRFQKRALLLFSLCQLPTSIQILMSVFTMATPDFRCAVPGLHNDTYIPQDSSHRAIINHSVPYDHETGLYDQCHIYDPSSHENIITNGNNNNNNDGNNINKDVHKSAASLVNVFPDIDDKTTIDIISRSNRSDFGVNYPGTYSSYNNSYGAGTGEQKNRTVVECDRWVYSTDVFESTLVADLNLVCDRQILITHSNFMAMLGLLSGSFLGGILADCFGRRLVTVVSLVLHVLAAASMYFITSYPALMAARLGVSTVGFVGILAAFTWAIEMVSAQHRMYIGMLTMIGWGCGLVLLSLVSFVVRDWQTLQLVMSAPLIVVALSFWILPESPRWLICKGRYEQTRKVLEHIAKVNDAELPKELLLQDDQTGESENVTPHVEVGEKQIQMAEKPNPKKESAVLQVLKSKIMVARFSIIFLNWMVCAMVYYGLALNVGSLVEGSLHLNFLLLSVLEVATYCVVILALKKVGRKTIYCPCLIIGGLACLGTIVPMVVESDQKWVSPVLCNIGRVGVTACFSIIFIITTELLPTVVRNSGLGLSSLLGRVGAMVSPYIGNLHYLVEGPMGKVLPMLIFGGLAVVAGLLALLLPETANQPLPETLEDAEAIRRKKKTPELPQAKI